MICPACNGLVPVIFDCRCCGAAAEDDGRAADRLGPYAPYEPRRDDGRSGPAEHAVCVHSVRCTSCGTGSEVSVILWP